MIKTRIAQGSNCKTCAVRNLCLPRTLDFEEIDHLNSIISSLRTIPKKEHAFHSSDKMQNLYAVHNGSCKEYWIDENGNERINNFYFPGDIIGMESVPSKRHIFSVAALDDTELCVIPIKEFFDLMKKSDNLLKRFLHLNSYKMQNDLSVRTSINANQRVCDFIINVYKRLKERNQFIDLMPLSMSQLEISNYLGIAYETVNRIFQQLKRKKIITMKHKNLSVIDISRLRAISSHMIIDYY